MTDANDRTPTPWSPCAGATVPEVPEGMALEVEFSSGNVVRHQYASTAGEPFHEGERFRLIPWPMTPREKFERLAEALGDGLEVETSQEYVCVSDTPGMLKTDREVILDVSGVESHSGPRDFNRRAIDLLDQLQIGRDDVAAMVGGGDV